MGARKITTSSGELQRRGVEGTPCLQPPPCPASHWHESWTHPQPASQDADTGTPWLGHLNCSECSASIRPLCCSSRALKLRNLQPLSRQPALQRGKAHCLPAAKEFGARPKFSRIQLWHAAVADYSALPL